ncbi:ester cyclase [Candidatus Poribacteria bacterium]
MIARKISLFLACIMLITFAGVLQATAQDPDIFPEDPNDPIIIAPISADEEALLATYQAASEALSAHDLDLWLSYCADDIVFDFVAGSVVVNGKEELRAFFEALFAGFPDWYGEPGNIMVSGNVVVEEHSVFGTHLGEWNGIPATGNGTQFAHVDIVEYEEGMVKRITSYGDMAAMMVQLGVLPAPEPMELVPSFTLPDPVPNELSPVEAVTEALARWEAQDLAGNAEFMRLDMEVFIPSLGAMLDRDSFIALSELVYFTAFPDTQVETVRTVDMGGGWVLVETVYTSTHTGPFMGVPGTGSPITLRGGLVYEVDEDGLIEYFASYYDNMTILAQIGALEPPQPDLLAVQQAFGEALLAQNIDQLMTHYTDDAMWDYVPAPPPSIGKAEIAEETAGMYESFPDFSTDEGLTLVSGNVLAHEHSAFGTHLGDFEGIPATGNTIQIVHVDIFDFEGDKIKKLTTYTDALSVLVQMGVMPAGELPEFVPSFTLPESEPTGLSPLDAVAEARERFNSHDMSSYAKIFHSDADLMLVLGVPLDRDAFIAVAEMYVASFSGLNWETTRSVDMGDGWVIEEVVYSGTNTGPYFGIPATGRSFPTRALHIWRVDEDGLVVNLRNYFDSLGILAQLGALGPPPPDPEANKAIVRRIYEEVWNQGNMDTADELVASDCAYHGAGIGEMSNVEGFKQLALGYRIAFPDMQWTIEDQFAEGDLVATRLTGTGTHLGPLMEIPPTGIQATTIAISMARIADGKIQESWSFVDMLGVMQQLGVIAPGRPSPENYTWGVPSEVTGGPGALETSIAAVQRMIDEAMNMQNMAVIDELFAADYTMHDPAASMEIKGPEGFKQWAGMMLAPYFSDSLVVVEDMIAEGDKVVVRWSWSGTHTGEFQGIPATGRPIAVTGISIHRFADGKFVESWVSYDMLGMMQQLTAPPEESTKDFSNVFFMSLEQGLNMISPPLEPVAPYTARSFAEEIGATVVIRYDRALRKFMGFTLAAPDDGFAINGGEGYIVNVSEAKTVAFTGAAWTNEPPVAAAPPAQRSSAWAFMVSGSVLDGDAMSASDGNYTAAVKSLRTGDVFTEAVDPSGYFAAAWADLSRRAVIGAGDRVEVAVLDSNGDIVSGPFVHDVTLDAIRDAVVNVRLRLGDIIPEKSALLQNYPNPFNPETWIPYHLSEANPVMVKIYSASGQLIRALDLGYRDAGVYASRSKAAYWDGKNEAGEEVTSGVYFYSIAAGDFFATRKMTVLR